jgi:cell shape-determining protein MreD
MRRTLVLLGCSLVLWTLVTQLNDLIAPWRVYLFAGALFVAHAALTQPRGPGLAASLLAGLACDANTPVAFGTHLLLFAAAHLIVTHVRHRIPRADVIAGVAVVLVANLALFLLFSFSQLHASPAPAVLWPRLFADLACSQVFLALITPWFFSLQDHALALAGVPPHEAD